MRNDVNDASGLLDPLGSPLDDFPDSAPPDGTPPESAPPAGAPPDGPTPPKKGLFGSKKKKEKAPPEAAAETPEKSGRKAPWSTKRKKGGRRRRVDKNEIIRIEALESALANQDSEIDPEAVISMYMPQRRTKQLAAALLRIGTLRLALLGILLLIASLFILSFMQEKMGNFTINLNRLELYRRGISIDESGEFTNPTARLTANTVENATCIAQEDLPDGLDDVEGDHNGPNYVAYTYYVRNAGKEDVDYTATIKLDGAAKGAEDATRVAVWFNGEKTVYAAPAADGGPEPGCVSFASPGVVVGFQRDIFRVGDVDKYTIVIWLDGDDPECVDAIVGGSVQFSMNIDAEFNDDTNLLVKFIQDIVDTLTGNKPIDAAGTTAPDFSDAEITYANRRNQ